MFCPRCGQQQVSNDVRFCSRCGFPLNVVSEALIGGGHLQREETTAQGERIFSPRQKGVRQGAMLMLSCILVVPVVSILSVFIFGGEEVLIPLAALLTFVGGLLRLVYALLFESNVIPRTLSNDGTGYMPTAYAPPRQMTGPPRGNALGPPQGTPVPVSAHRRINTGELASPPSITENTTRLLAKERHSTEEPSSTG